MLTEVFAAVDDTVEVGAQLLKIDSDGTATVTAASPAPAAEAAAVAAAPTPAVAAATAVAAPAAGARVPSIQFLGKAGWATRRTPGAEAAAAAAPAVALAPAVVAGGVAGEVNFEALEARFGRPVMTEIEIAMVDSGGAEDDMLMFG